MYLTELQELRSVEEQLVLALPKMAETAQNSQLKQAIQSHLFMAAPRPRTPSGTPIVAGPLAPLDLPPIASPCMALLTHARVLLLAGRVMASPAPW
jgi:hypothetical protein